MQLKPQDLLFLLKLVAVRNKSWTFNQLAAELGMSASEVHAASNRAIRAGLATKQDDRIRPHAGHLTEFLVHGIQYMFVPERGGLCTGMPTASAVKPLSARLSARNEPQPVWPDLDGRSKGIALSPLYKSAPFAAKKDPLLYELLALVDAVRGGPARAGELAKEELALRLSTIEGSDSAMLNNDNDENIVIGETVVVPRQALQELVHRYHIRRLALFGSAARGRLGVHSDIDLLVEFETGQAPSLGGMVQLQDEFARLFGGRQVDLATPTILNNPYRRRAIERDMQELYAA